MDVRAPVEFARGSIPGSVNLPLLDDEQRHEIGLRYKHAGQDEAIALGLKLIKGDVKQRRIDAWTDFTRQHPEGYLFCFRGGLRSRITRDWLRDAGTEYPLIPGGYKKMRTWLMQELETGSRELPYLILGGRTGTGKTHLLPRLRASIDLEGLAGHRGSSFGKLLDAQPGNIDFENSLAVAMLRHRLSDTVRQHKNPVFLEDEGRMIGRVCIPQTLRERMQQLPVVLLEEPLQRRVEVVMKDYIVDLLELYQKALGEDQGYLQFANHHRVALQKITKRFGGQRVKETLELFEAAFAEHQRTNSTELFKPYISALLCDYYDPMYDYQFERKNRTVLFQGSADEVAEWASDDATRQACLVAH